MDKDQREVLITWRVELVENLNMEGGLFTQLMAKKVLNQRTINNIKMKRTPEEQAEELLNYLPKKDCFDKLCEALEADDQDEIVTKYLKTPLDSAKNSCQQKEPTTAKAPSEIPQSSSLETTDSAVVQPSDKTSTISVIRIKEPDNNHLCIEYQNPPPQSPVKRRRLEEISNETQIYDLDNTRYVHKHFIAQESGACMPSDKTLAVVSVVNPQNVLNNPNISDPARYLAAYGKQISHSSPQHVYLSDQNSSLSAPSKINISSSIHIPPMRSQSHTDTMHPHQYLRQEGLLFSQKNSHADSVDNLRMSGSGDITQVDGSVPDFNGGPPIMSAAAQAAINLSDPQLLTSQVASKMSSASPFQSIHLPPSMPSDLIDMDLPDGCVNVKVEHSSRQFFISNYKKSYPMRRIPRGLFLIINVDEVEGKPPRKGTNFDRDNLMNLLCRLHFDPVVYNDSDGLSAQEIVIKLKDFARRREHSESDACFICLLSHGEEGYIFGTDGKRIPLDEIFLLFGNTNCKGLMGKPKVFIIQACRGGILDKGVRMDEPDGGNIPNASPASLPVTQLPTMSDMLICYPTMAGYYAWRNRARGSWYIEAIVQVFMKYAKSEDVCVMLNRVNQLVSRKVSECNQQEMNQMSQMSEYKSSLRQPHLYLFPGIECSHN